ncbi:response regulator [Paenibacillus sp. MWE-103]|uniref:Response regulator n=1 Tax=Paenibacillus artemisiicola TaxID=1172618 RepID=A0ABS3WFD0_9BACL|nr:response regulator [Paenibacillus artemisiicola]MBO7747018.1 response regulator [Paenibacillus artemisiicola]
MHKVLFVDDDILVRVGLRILINWTDAGWEIAGEASNGAQALEMIEALRPDLLIMDMKMPQMDGAVLLQRLRERDRRLRIIVLSCYDDYAYMREALAAGANEYILKPELTSAVLEAAIGRIREQINETEQRDKEYYQLKKQAALQTHFARDSFFRELLRGSYTSRDELDAAVVKHGIDLPDRAYAVMLFSADKHLGVPDHQGTQKREAVDNALFNIIHGQLQTISVSCMIREADSGDYIAVVSGSSDEGLLQEAEHAANRAVQAAAAYTRLQLTVGIGAPVRDPLRLREAFVSARDALRCRLLCENQAVFTYVQAGGVDDGRLREGLKALQVRLQELFTALAGGDMNRGEALTYSLVGDICRSGSVRMLKALCVELAGWYNRQADYAHFEDGPVPECVNLSADELLNTRVPSELAQLFLERAGRLQATGMPLPSAAVAPPIRKAIEYIQTYYERHITLADLSDHIGMSKSHLSAVFREQTGLNFVDYVTHYRIERAKRLLRTDAGKIYEIATKVGFDNEKYFSQVFRSKVGVTPTEYKKMTF